MGRCVLIAAVTAVWVLAMGDAAIAAGSRGGTKPSGGMTKPSGGTARSAPTRTGGGRSAAGGASRSPAQPKMPTGSGTSMRGGVSTQSQANSRAMQQSLQSVNSRSSASAPKPGTQRSAPATSGQRSQGAAASRMSSTQQQNVDHLKTDLASIKQGSQVTPEQKTALKGDLMAMADGATKPDPALVDSLSNSLSQAMADGNLTVQEKARLAKDIEAVMNSANIPAAEAQKAIADAQAILTASGITRSEVEAVVGDLQAIATEAKKNVPSGGSAPTSGARKGRLRR